MTGLRNLEINRNKIAYPFANCAAALSFGGSCLP